MIHSPALVAFWALPGTWSSCAPCSCCRHPFLSIRHGCGGWPSSCLHLDEPYGTASRVSVIVSWAGLSDETLLSSLGQRKVIHVFGRDAVTHWLIDRDAKMPERIILPAVAWGNVTLTDGPQLSGLVLRRRLRTIHRRWLSARKQLV